MLRDDCIRLVEILASSTRTEEQEGAVLWRARKLLPHFDLVAAYYANNRALSIAELVDEALRQQADRAHEPAPPFITEEMLLDSVAYLQRRAKELGEKNLYILIPLDLEYPRAYLPEMIRQTHVDSTPGEIVAELHRRQAAAGVEGGGAGQGRTPLPPRWLREAGA